LLFLGSKVVNKVVCLPIVVRNLLYARQNTPIVNSGVADRIESKVEAATERVIQRSENVSSESIKS
jgi:hypothetical protein